MKKVISYIVDVVEFQDGHTQTVRWTIFDNLREARSFFRTCVNYYLGMSFVTDSPSVEVRLQKEVEKDKFERIDEFTKNFRLYLHRPIQLNASENERLD